MTEPKIDAFRSTYDFLSNFYPSVVELDGVKYPTVEHAFQASKTANPDERHYILTAGNAGEAKKRGRKVTLREDWDDVKLQIMLDLLRQKFFRTTLGVLLAFTGDAELEEGNWWGDRFWGTVRGDGANWLGVLLMHVRKEVQQNQKIPTIFLRNRERMW